MQISGIQVGPIGTNCYLLGDETAGVCALIDPGDDARAIARMLRESGLKPKLILLTHGHHDHCLAVPELLEQFPNLPVYIHRADCEAPACPPLFPALPEAPTRHYYDESDVLSLGSIAIAVLHTPGHTRGSVTLRAENALFTGDTLFCGSCGRTDLAGGSYAEMMASLARIGTLEGDFLVLPGHEQSSTLNAERAQNDYLRMALGQ